MAKKKKYTPPPEICWADQVGNRWEAEGIDPGRIFESGERVAQSYLPGIMIVTKDLPPGTPPRSLAQVERAIAQFKLPNGRTEEMNLISSMQGARPILEMHWPRIQPTLC